LSVVALRLTMMLGVGRSEGLAGKISTELVEKPVAGAPGRIPFGDDSPDFLWVGDAARACALAVHSGLAGSRKYNVKGDTRSLDDAAHIVRRLVPGADLTLAPGKAGLQQNIDTSGIEKDLGFRAETMLEDQLAQLVEQARARR
jgi:nucleoside-diphosphate-sugar epimerase